jgi:hypothetical protein
MESELLHNQSIKYARETRGQDAQYSRASYFNRYIVN